MKKEETEVQAVEKKPTSIATGAEASPNSLGRSIFKSTTKCNTRSTTARMEQKKVQDKSSRTTKSSSVSFES